MDLEIDESSLTGETTARRKEVEMCNPVTVANGNGYPNGYANGTAMQIEPVALADRSCIAYMGTLVRNGTCLCVRRKEQLTHTDIVIACRTRFRCRDCDRDRN